MIIFLYGPDTFRSRQKLKLLKEKFFNDVDPSGRGLVEFKNEGANFNNLRQSLNTNSFLTRKRMVVIEGMLTKKITDEVEIIELLKKTATDDNNILVIWEADDFETSGKLFKYLNSQKNVEDFKKLKDIELVKWIKNKFLSSGVKVDNNQAVRLINMVGNDMWQLNQEIDKLTAYSGKEKKLNDADIELLLTANFNESIFQLTDAVTERSQAKALELIDNHLNSGMNESYLLAMLTRQFRIMLLIKSLSERGYDLSQINSSLDYHPYVIKKTWSQCTKYSLEKLKLIYGQLLAIDNALKSGSKNFKTLINMLVFSNDG